MTKAYSEEKSGAVLLRRAVVGPWSLNAYVLVCRSSGHSLLVDPGAEPETLFDMLEGSQPKGIVVTHGHPDHVGALAQARRRLNAPVLAHAGGIASDRPVSDGDIVPMGDVTVRFFHAPGHTPDQICLGVEGDRHYLVGDTVFEGGPGHTDTPEAFSQTLVTLETVVLAWPDEAVCHPGHGPGFRLGDKRGAIQGFLAKDHGDFCGDATWTL